MYVSLGVRVRGTLGFCGTLVYTTRHTKIYEEELVS
jgi:hypothetical protein